MNGCNKYSHCSLNFLFPFVLLATHLEFFVKDFKKCVGNQSIFPYDFDDVVKISVIQRLEEEPFRRVQPRNGYLYLLFFKKGVERI